MSNQQKTLSNIGTDCCREPRSWEIEIAMAIWLLVKIGVPKDQLHLEPSFGGVVVIRKNITVTMWICVKILYLQNLYILWLDNLAILGVSQIFRETLTNGVFYGFLSHNPQVLWWATDGLHWPSHEHPIAEMMIPSVTQLNMQGWCSQWFVRGIRNSTSRWLLLVNVRNLPSDA